MPGIYDITRHLALRLLPERALREFKKVHDRRVLRGATPAAEPDLEIVAELVRGGDIVVDVGANFGLYTKVLSDLVGPTGRVYGIEPVPETFDILVTNIERLDLANVIPLNLAASERAGDATMEIPRRPKGGENFYRARLSDAPDGTLRRVVVATAPLDDMLRDAGTVSFVKVDVEGHELSCLAGATRLIAQQPAWLIEVSTDPCNDGSGGHRLFSRLAGHGYSPWYVRNGSLLPFAEGIRSTNYFFLGDGHEAALRERAPDLFG